MKNRLVNLLTLAGGMVLSGILGNNADRGLLRLIPFINKYSESLARFRPLFILLGFVPFILFILRYKKAYEESSLLNKFHQDYLNLLPQYWKQKDEEGLSKLSRLFLEDLVESFSLHSACFYCPRPSDSESVVHRISSYGIGEENLDGVQKLKCHPSQGGVVGKVFCTLENIVVTFSLISDPNEPEKTKCIASDKDYKFPFRTDSKCPDFKSTFVIPIVSSDEQSNKCVGVVCLNSAKKDGFSDKKMRQRPIKASGYIELAALIFLKG